MEEMSVSSRLAFAVEMDGDDDVGVQVVAEDVGGQVVEDAAVDEIVAVGALNGGEDAGNGDGGAHGRGQRAAGEGDGLKSVEVGGDAAEGDGHAIVVEGSRL